MYTPARLKDMNLPFSSQDTGELAVLTGFQVIWVVTELLLVLKVPLWQAQDQTPRPSLTPQPSMSETATAERLLYVHSHPEIWLLSDTYLGRWNQQGCQWREGCNGTFRIYSSPNLDQQCLYLWYIPHRHI